MQLPVLQPYFKDLRPNDIVSAAASPFFTARQLATIYGFPAPNLSLSPVVGVLSFGGGMYGRIDANGVLTNGDVQKYWAYQGIAASQMPKVIVKMFGGATNNLSYRSGTLENTLDVSVVGSCCANPNLTIILYIFPNPYSFTLAFQTMLDGVTVSGVLLKPTIISVSWGCPEIAYLQNGVDFTGDLAGLSRVLSTATHLGLNVCVASGDFGSTDGNGTPLLSCDFPSACPYVTAVGGTTLSCPTGVYDSQTTETVWNDGVLGGSFYATGGGVSAYYTKPAYQRLVSGTMRGVPDIALDADPDTGIVLYQNGMLYSGIGGTSMSAPLFAAYLASIGPKGFVNPLMYSASNTCFRDITLGCNYNTSLSTATKSYSAGPGYDFCSGLGSIVGGTLMPVLANAVPTTVLAMSVSILPKSPITVSLSNKTYNLVGTILPENVTNKSLLWTSSNSSVATVNNNGTVTLIKSGSTIITATTKDGTYLSSSVSMSVTPSRVLANSIAVTPRNLTLSTGKSVTVKATVLPSNASDPTVRWYSNNLRVVTVDQITGFIRAIGTGTASVLAITKDGSNKTATLSVTVSRTATVKM